MHNYVCIEGDQFFHIFLQEFDHPYELLKDEESLFFKLVSETGEFMSATLTSIAKEVDFIPLYTYNERTRVFIYS